MSKDKAGRYQVKVLFDGYSKNTEQGTLANCTCTLLKGPKYIIVDTMTPWDSQKLTDALKQQKLTCDDIDYVICTHGHSDHVGCNHLFKKAIHVVGYCISHGDLYFHHDFNNKKEYMIDAFVKVIATPGHMMQHVSVVVRTEDKGVVVVAGDLFESEADLKDDSIWMNAGSDSEELQMENRQIVLAAANWIVPGHGPMFKVKDVELKTT